MPNVSSPGVYVEEVDVAARAIALGPTATAAFVGPTRAGPVDGTPVPLTSLSAFERLYGGPQPLRLDDGAGGIAAQPNHLAHAVRAFFQNGGMRLYVARTVHRALAARATVADGDADDARITVHAGAPGSLGNGTVWLRERHSPVALRGMTRAEPGTLLHTVNASGAVECLRAPDGTWRDRAGRAVVRGRVGVSRVVTLEIACQDADGVRRESWTDLAFGRGHTRWAGAVLSAEAAESGLAALWLQVGDAVDAWALLDAVRALAPAPGEAVALPLAGGSDGQLAPLGDADQPGSYAAALARLAPLTDVRTVAAPGASARADGAALQAALVAHASQPRAWRLALLDPAPHSAVDDVAAQRAAFDSSHAAFYWPWIVVPDPLAPGGTVAAALSVPPSGVVAGMLARSDAQRNVFHAPANLDVRAAVRAELPVTQGEEQRLAPLGINCFREFMGRGLLLWGARLASSDPAWRYVQLRRGINAFEAALDEGLRWVVFEPNGAALWTRVRRSVEDFLFDQWRAGALQGSRPQDAWFVRCDRSTMTRADIAQGRLVCEIGMALVAAAEFHILRWIGHSADALQPGG